MGEGCGACEDGVLRGCHQTVTVCVCLLTSITPTVIIFTSLTFYNFINTLKYGVWMSLSTCLHACIKLVSSCPSDPFTPPTDTTTLLVARYLLIKLWLLDNCLQAEVYLDHRSYVYSLDVISSVIQQSLYACTSIVMCMIL